METGTALDTISGGQKIHFLAILLPLITFILYKVNFWIIVIYTVLLAIHSIYIYTLIAFKNNSTQSVLYPKDKKKMSEFYYIPYVWFFVVITIINIIVFFYSLYLAIVNFGESYNQILLLAYIFVFSFEIFMLIVMRYYRKLIPKLKQK